MSEKRLKVAYLLGSLNRGGTETLLLDVLLCSRKVQFDMFVIYRKAGELSDGFYSSGVPIYQVTRGHVTNCLIYLLKLRKLLKQEKADIIHVHQRVDTIYAWIASLGLKQKIVQTLHDFDFQYSKFSRLLIRLSFCFANRNIFVSEYQKRYYQSAYKLSNYNSLSIVYNGINFAKLNHQEKQSLRKDLAISDKCLLLGMVGNFNSVRDQLTICRFLDLMAHRNIDFKFLFVGKKETNNPKLYDICYSFCLNKNLSEKVVFLGCRSDVPVLLSQMDAFIYSSDHDTFGIAVIEAIATGIPVFVNDWEVMKEITNKGEKATLYRSKEEQDLLEKFMRFYAHPGSFYEKAKENAEWAKREFSIDRHIKSLNHLYIGLNSDNS